MSGYKPGSFFVTQIPGPAGFWISVGETLAGVGSRYSHAGMIVSEDGDIVEAEPGGARLAHISEYAGPATLICDGPVQMDIENYKKERGADLNPAELAPFEKMARLDVVAQTKALISTPYSALDYFSLAALHLHLPSQWIRQRVESSGHLICSQLVDLAYLRAGIHLFNDHPYRLQPKKTRVPGDVMPSDLAKWAANWEHQHR